MGDYGLGVIISASHNPAPDNGIKLVGHDGRKLSDETESLIEGCFDRADDHRPIGAEVGFLGSSRAELDAYLDFLEAIVPERLDGMNTRS